MRSGFVLRRAWDQDRASERCSTSSPKHFDKPVFRAKTIQFQNQATYAEAPINPKPAQSPQHATGLLCTALHSELMELALTARLGSFVAKHRTRIPELLGTLAKQPVLKDGTHHGCCTFWPQGTGAIAPILEAIHLLGDHICALTDTTTKQVRFLEKRRTYLTEP